MVGRLIRTELILGKVIVLMFITMPIALLAVYATMIPEEAATYGLVTVYICFFPAALLARPSKFGADEMFCTFPVPRGSIMTARYVLCAAVAVAVLTVAQPTNYLIALIAGRTPSGFDWKALAQSVAVFCVVAGVMAPFVVRFGFLGVMVFLLAVNVLTVAVFVLTSLGLIRDGLAFFFRTVPAAVRSAQNALGAPAYQLAVLAVGGLVGWGSLRVSQKLFGRKEF